MNQRLSKRLAALLTCTALASGVLIGCGGGSSSTAGNTDAIISGVAAVGAPLANAAVVVKDANNESVSATADANGSYKANVSGKSAPFMIKATGVVGGVSTSYYSALETAPKSGETLIANVTPLTNAIIAQSSSGDPATVFADVKANKAGIDPAKVQAAKTKLLAALNDYIVALGGTANADPIKTKFNANSTDAMDKVLDLIKINTQVTTTGGVTKADVALTPNGGATKTVTQDDTTAIAATKKPTDPTANEKALDTSGIQTLFSGFNAAVASSAAYGTNGANFAALLDANMLDQGRDKTAFLAQITSALTGTTSDFKWGSTFEIPLIERCDAVAKVCWLQLTMNNGGGVYDKFAGAVKKDATSGKWLFYGDRQVFKYSTGWVAQKQSDGTFRLGMNVYIPYNTTQTLNTAVLSISFDSGATTSASNDLYFGVDASCTNSSNFLTTSGQCGTNFVQLTDAKITAINDAITAGTFRFKIVLSNNGSTTGAKTMDWVRLPATALGLTSANVANYASSFPSVTASQLGTNSVAFTAPGTADGVQIKVKTNNVVTGNTNWSGNGSMGVASLAGIASVTKAYNSCVANGDAVAQCSSSYGAGGVITWIHLSTKDAQGRSFWAGYGNYN